PFRHSWQALEPLRGLTGAPLDALLDRFQILGRLRFGRRIGGLDASEFATGLSKKMSSYASAWSSSDVSLPPPQRLSPGWRQVGRRPAAAAVNCRVSGGRPSRNAPPGSGRSPASGRYRAGEWHPPLRPSSSRSAPAARAAPAWGSCRPGPVAWL